MAGYDDGDPLNVRIRVAFGAVITADPGTWAWTDVTSFWHPSSPVDIAWGRSPTSEQAETSTMRLTLKNTGGEFTAYDPRSPHWPNVIEWTPISYDIDLGDGAGWRNRFSGYVNKWPVEWPAGSSKMALATIDCVGIIARIGRGKPSPQSPMKRTTLASNPVDYWPFEDGGDSSQGASALSGHLPAVTRGTVEFEQVKDLIYTAGGQQDYGTGPLPNLNKGGSLQAVLTPEAAAATTGEWTVQVSAEVRAATASTDVVLMDIVTTGGTYSRLQLWHTESTTHTILTAYVNGVAQANLIDLSSTTSSFTGFRITAQQVGANQVIRLYEGRNTPSATATVSGTVGTVRAITLNSIGAADATNRLIFGHLAVWATADPGMPLSFTVDPYGQAVLPAERAYDNEAVHLRLARLAAEGRLSMVVTAGADDDDVTRMGRQPAGTTLELMQQCETTGQGLIREEGFGLGYLDRAGRYNAPVVLTLDAALRQLGLPFRPVTGDQQMRNLWTVSRAGGSTAVAADQGLIDRQGEVEGTATIGVRTDQDIADHALWRLHLSTPAEPRYDELSIDLGAHRELAAAWTACTSGSRIQVINPPPQNRPGTVDQLIVGGRETFTGRRSWKASMNVVPASSWQVAEAGGVQRVPADSSTLATALPAGGSLVVSDAFTTRTVAAGFGTAETGGSWTVEGTAAEFSVSAGRARMSVASVQTSRRAIAGPALTDGDLVASTFAPVAAGSDIQPMLAMRWTDNNNTYLFLAELHTDGSIIASIKKRVGGVQTSLAEGDTGLRHTGVGAGVRMRARCAGTTLSLRIWRHGTPEPPDSVWHAITSDAALTAGRTALRAILSTGNSNVLPVEVAWDDVSAYDATTLSIASTAADGVWTTDPADFPMAITVGGEPVLLSAITGTTSPQNGTVSARGMDGWRRDWPAGTTVDVAAPAIVPL
ncbi:MAG: hypothetical protein ABW000_07290 [Actinoplanes sp.]